ncbi:MFS transporter [Actinokineospora globicatena]|uniref:MFS transporter n=1 Tax=Actinokineospora globicatena TaxID=103729 RepID=UPI0020A39DB9|nr:MFS transporter [Actinokineospora globicatena]MCP2303950.1 MFS transporter, DHA2 family, multidrug resistance protein [Actinokineospora globicatena]GLW78888.1 MFS transporter [Actinokineospora globicatena]GLW86699.1 MFS transporter [Actinokineospora globicatena]
MSSAPGPEVGTGAPARPWRGLALLTFPLIVLALDVSVLFLAAPALSRDLGASPAQLLWITDIYGFCIAGFLIVMGVLGDRVGRRRLLVIGCLAFAGASTLAAFAPTAGWLIAARALLGLAGATLMPSTLALIRVLFPDEGERQKAIAIWMTAFSASVALGPVLGGVVIDQLWWGAVFLFPVPLLVVFAVLAHRTLPEERVEDPAPLDLLSVGLIAGTMLGVAYAIKSAAVGDLGVLTIAVFAAAVVAGVVAVRRQFHTRHPLIEPALLTNRRLLAGLALLLMSVTAMNGFYFLVPQYFQHVQGRSATSTGLLMLPLAGAAVVASLATPPLLGKIRPPFLVASGAILAGAGFLALSLHSGPLSTLTLTLLGCAVVAGISAMGVVMTDLVVGLAPPRHAGAAAGLSETAGELGVALGVAILGSVSVFAYRATVEGSAAPLDDTTRTTVADSIASARTLAENSPPQRDTILDVAADAFVSGLSWAAVTATAAMALCVLLALTILRTTSTPAEE